jgi:adenylate kinase
MRRIVLAFSTSVLLASVAPAQAPLDPMVILLVGPPGAGKTTQAKNLAKKYRIPAISMSDLLKKEAGWLKTQLKKNMKAQLESGDLLNDEEANALMARRFARADAARGFVLDGYPLTAKHAEYLDQSLKERGLPPPIVVYLDVPDNVARERMRQRGRADDKPETIEKRLARYRSESQMVLDRYGAGVHRVNGTLSEKEVWLAIERSLPAVR